MLYRSFFSSEISKCQHQIRGSERKVLCQNPWLYNVSFRDHKSFCVIKVIGSVDHSMCHKFDSDILHLKYFVQNDNKP